MTLFKSLITAAMLAVPAPLLAATTIYETSGDVVLDPIFGFADYAGSNGDLSITITGALFGDVLDASLVVADAGQALLESFDTVDFDIDFSGASDTARITFGSLIGDAVALFGSTATVEFFFDPSAADVSLAPDFIFLEDVTAQVVSDVAPVPLPASLPLLGAALVGFAALRRKQRRS